MKNLVFIISLFFIAHSTLFSQSSEIVTVKGDSLVGRVVGGVNIREVIGNVVITQEDLVINCDRAIQYLVKNEIELIDNVVVKQDTLTMITDRAYYYGDEKYAETETLVRLTQPGLDLTADKGIYYFDLNRAEFLGDVHLVDSLIDLRSVKLTYLREIEELIAVEDVRVSDSTSIIFADSLVHFREAEISEAYGNVKIDNFLNDIIIYGDTLKSRNKENYSRITGSPLFIQTDTTAQGKIDSLMIASVVMESYTDSTRKFIATDSVKIIKGEFASRNEKSILYRADGIIETTKKENVRTQPVLWYDNSQLVGDSVFIHLKNDQLEYIDIKSNSIIITENEGYDWRYNQISGVEIKMFFNDSTIERTEVFNNVLSIYYLFEDSKANGLLKSSAENGKILFENGKVVDVKLYGSPKSEYHPENTIKGKSREFTLPLFELFGNRPQKKEFKKLIRENE